MCVCLFNWVCVCARERGRENWVGESGRERATEWCCPSPSVRGSRAECLSARTDQYRNGLGQYQKSWQHDFKWFKMVNYCLLTLTVNHSLSAWTDWSLRVKSWPAVITSEPWPVTINQYFFSFSDRNTSAFWQKAIRTLFLPRLWVTGLAKRQVLHHRHMTKPATFKVAWTPSGEERRRCQQNRATVSQFCKVQFSTSITYLHNLPFCQLIVITSSFINMDGQAHFVITTFSGHLYSCWNILWRRKKTLQAELCYSISILQSAVFNINRIFT